MKKYILIIIISLTTLSCSNSNIVSDNVITTKSVNKNLQVITKEVKSYSDVLSRKDLNYIQKDTIVYKTYITKYKDILLINPTTNKIEYKIDNYSGIFYTVMIFVIILLVLVIILSIAVSE